MTTSKQASGNLPVVIQTEHFADQRSFSSLFAGRVSTVFRNVSTAFDRALNFCVQAKRSVSIHRTDPDAVRPGPPAGNVRIRMLLTRDSLTEGGRLRTRSVVRKKQPVSPAELHSKEGPRHPPDTQASIRLIRTPAPFPHLSIMRGLPERRLSRHSLHGSHDAQHRDEPHRSQQQECRPGCKPPGQTVLRAQDGIPVNGHPAGCRPVNGSGGR